MKSKFSKMLGLKKYVICAKAAQGTMVVFEFKFSRTCWEESSWKTKKIKKNCKISIQASNG